MLHVVIQWDPIFGECPLGGKDTPSKYGMLLGRPTYLARCPCGNKRCNGLISRYVHNDVICTEQTLALYESSQNLLPQYINTFSALVNSGRMDIDLIMWCDDAKSLLEYLGRVSFYQDPINNRWRYHFAECRLVIGLAEMALQQKPLPPLLTSGKEEGDNEPSL